MFEEINKSVERAKRRRLDALARFHIGDVCYPLYQTWSPVIWGIIVDISVATHKISVNLNGIVRQYDPEELVLTSPENKEPNTTMEDKQRILDEIERTVSSAFWASKSERIAKKLTASFGKKELDQKLFLLKTVNAVENYIQKKVEPYTKGLKRDNWGAIHKIIEVLQDLGVNAECTGVDSSHYKVEGGSKIWNYILSFVNVSGKKVEIYYQIVGSAAGTVDDPWGAYDIIAGPTYGRIVKASKNVTAKASRGAEKLYQPIQLALVDYMAGSCTTGPALKLIRDLDDCVEKSKKLFDQKDYAGAQKALEPLKQGLKQLNPGITGSWKRWNLPLNQYRDLYRHYWKRLGDAYIGVRQDIDYIVSQYINKED